MDKNRDTRVILFNMLVAHADYSQKGQCHTASMIDELAKNTRWVEVYSLEKSRDRESTESSNEIPHGDRSKQDTKTLRLR